MIAILFLVIGVLSLLFSDANEAAWDKWKRNVIWISAGIIVMQIAYPFFGLFVDKSADLDAIGGALSWEFWNKIISPLIGLLLALASFAFLLMMFYAFYIMIIGAGDEEQYKKGKNTFIYAFIGFLLIQLPQKIVSILYGRLPECNKDASRNMWNFATNPCKMDYGLNTSEALITVANIFRTINTFLTLICVVLALYAGFLIFTSHGDESQITKAKKIVIYIAIGLVLLVASHAIFTFILASTSAR